MFEVSNIQKIKNVIVVSTSFMYDFTMYIVDYITDTGFLLPLDD